MPNAHHGRAALQIPERLFDMRSDAGQNAPFRNKEIEAELLKAIAAEMAIRRSPDELYHRFDIGRYNQLKAMPSCAKLSLSPAYIACNLAISSSSRQGMMGNQRCWPISAISENDNACSMLE